MIKFRQKDFSLLSSVVSGAVTGGTLGSTVTSLSPTLREYINKKAKTDKKSGKGVLIASGVGMLVGASLGALSYAIKGIGDSINNKKTVDRRLLVTVDEILKKDHFKEGKDYTRDPQTANKLKMKVCIVLSKYSDDLRILINTISDIKLKRLTDEVIKRIPNSSVINEKMTDKFNDITISTISDSSADAGLVAGIVEHFIHSGYPVYIVEVG